MKEEAIFVVPRSFLGDFLAFQGFKPVQSVSPEEWVHAGKYRSRTQMEEDPSFKQLIPYIVIRYSNKIFRYKRTKRGGENRLHHFYSIGVGGHINPADDNLFETEDQLLYEAALRELHEEVKIQGEVQLQHVGFINDESNEVGKVHLGLVYEAWPSSPDISPRESALSQGEWVDVNHLLNGVDYESWSLYLIKNYLLSQG